MWLLLPPQESWGSSCPSSSSTSQLPSPPTSLADPGLLPQHKPLSAKWICTGIPTFRWTQILLNLLWASGSPWGYDRKGWRGSTNTGRTENCSQEGTKCGNGQEKGWVFLPDIPLMHTWPIGNSMAATQRKISQTLSSQSQTAVGTQKRPWGRSQHTATLSACPHFNIRHIFVFIIMGNTHEIMPRLLLLITASCNVIPENIFHSHCQKQNYWWFVVVVH